MSENSKRENREIPSTSEPRGPERSVNASGGTTDAHVGGKSDGSVVKSDGSVVPAKSANNDVAEASAEPMEERDSAKRNAQQSAARRTSSRAKRASRGLLGVREAARKDRTLVFESLLHHVSVDCLRDAFFNLKKTAAVGVDEVSWQEYERDLEDNIVDLHGRVHRGAYRAKPSKRVWIPKPDGRQRPIGIASLEDKVVQQAVVWILQAIYEHGFRSNRGCHQALDALSVAITSKQVNWVLDADIAGFFDEIDHEWLIRFVEHRISDNRILRLIKKWLCAGVSEEGEWSKTTVGTPQGAVISPQLANVYLHYVFDLWIEHWRAHHAHGEVIVVRYADDFVIGFEHEHEAKRCLRELRERFARFGLKLHDEKTRLIEFGRYATYRRERRGEDKPETFDFLGFTHVCTKSRQNGRFRVKRLSNRKRMTRTLASIKDHLRRRMHRPVGETGRWLRRVVQGWLNYHAVPGNSMRLNQFDKAVKQLWLHSLRRRSQTGRARWTWTRFARLAARYLPKPRILHDTPWVRFHARLKAGAG